MDCHDARLLLTLQRREPEQLDRVELEAIERHVELCPGCQTWNQSEARFEAAVTTIVKNVPLPAGLKDKIAAGLAHSRLPRRKAWAAAAAALLLAIGATGIYFWQRPVAINWEEFPVASEVSRPEVVQAYFADLGYAMTPPLEFEYEFLVSYEPKKFQGKYVPRLTFQCRREKGGFVTAHVYCLRDRDFYVGDEGEAQIAIGPHRQIHLFREGHELYVVEFNGGDLRLLQRQPV